MFKLDGAAGSAIKGIQMFRFNSNSTVSGQADHQSAARHGVVTIGYDQRLSIWEVLLPPVRAVGLGQVGDSLKNSPDSLSVKWLNGSAVNVSDVASVVVLVDDTQNSSLGSNILCVVVGEGLQLFNVSNLKR